MQHALDAVERWLDEAGRLADAGDMEAASRALNAAGRMRRLAKTLGERAAERSAREAAQSVDYVARLRDKLSAVVERIKREAAGASDMDKTCGTADQDAD